MDDGNNGPAVPGLITATIFSQNAVKVLRGTDFNLGSKPGITLKWNDCILILFYGEGRESQELAKIWAVAASKVAGAVFAACNLTIEKEVAKAFMNLHKMNSTYRSYALKGIPFIITYQNGFPVGFYNGDRTVQQLVDFSLTLACKVDYSEPIQVGAGVAISSDENLKMDGYAEYDESRKDSLAYKAGTSVRQFGVGTTTGGAQTTAAQTAGEAAPVDQSGET